MQNECLPYSIATKSNFEFCVGIKYLIILLLYVSYISIINFKKQYFFKNLLLCSEKS